jgi:hypothetical protein
LLLAEKPNPDGRATIMLAHETLLWEWPELHDWVECHRALLQRIQTLIAALGDADAGVRRNAAKVLGQLGPPASKAVRALITALGDDNIEVRGRAA